MENNNTEAVHWYGAWIKSGEEYRKRFERVTELKGLKYIRYSRRHYLVYTNCVALLALGAEFLIAVDCDSDGNFMVWDTEVEEGAE